VGTVIRAGVDRRLRAPRHAGDPDFTTALVTELDKMKIPERILPSPLKSSTAVWRLLWAGSGSSDLSPSGGGHLRECLLLT
jgi:hypothetical protein